MSMSLGVNKRTLYGWLGTGERKKKNIYQLDSSTPQKTQTCSYWNLPTVLRRGETAHFIIFAYDLKRCVTAMGIPAILCTGK